MDELVELFKLQVNLHGIDKFVPLLVGDIDDENGSDDVFSEAGSEDYLSDSEVGGDSSEDDVSSIDGDEYGSDETESDVESVGDNAVGFWNNNDVIHLHAPPIFGSRHCPPLGSVEDTMHGICDCRDFGMNMCAKEDEFQFFATIDYVNEIMEATNSIESPDRIASNLLRKRLYKMLFHATDYGILEKKERRKLPNCAVAKIRQIYPSLSGDYMGFKEN